MGKPDVDTLLDRKESEIKSLRMRIAELELVITTIDTELVLNSQLKQIVDYTMGPKVH